MGPLDGEPSTMAVGDGAPLCGVATRAVALVGEACGEPEALAAAASHSTAAGAPAAAAALFGDNASAVAFAGAEGGGIGR